MHIYYSDKLNSLKDVFGTTKIELKEDFVKVGNVQYPIVNDVIILIEPKYYTDLVRAKLKETSEAGENISDAFAEDIQYSFGEEWKSYSDIKPEHEKEFDLYFDIVNIDSLKNSKVCDLGCGIGRWSYFLKDKCKELILVDFSDAIFEARRNLQDSTNCLFFMGDLKKLPFKDDFADLLYSLGVLHHLPSDCLQEVRGLKNYASNILIYLYYSLDNRPFYFKLALAFVTIVRKLLAKNRSILFRKIISLFITLTVYKPFIIVGSFLNLFGLGKFVPLYEAYHPHSIGRLEQDVYDRFFTSIEQRVSKKQVEMLNDTFGEILISEKIPYWHFLCKR